ncbi:MAG: hypothetical protein AAB956_02810 [Patescibacteria group bacterium]
MMTLWHRRLLYIFLIILFLILAPVISFYAAGYEFDFSSKQVRHTGILILTSEPKGANINLGDKRKYNWLYDWFYQDTELKTPQKLRNLLPDEYEVTLTKDSYFDYQRRITINPGQTFLLDKIILFRRTQPEAVSEQSVSGGYLSRQGQYLAVLTKESLVILELTSGQKREIPLAAEKIGNALVKILWAPSDKKVLITGGSYPVFNIETGIKEGAVKDYVFSPIANIKWDSFSDNKLYLEQNNRLYQFDLIVKKATLISNAPVSQDFLVRNNNLLTLTKLNDGWMLNITVLASDEQIGSIVLPAAAAYLFLEKADDFIYLYDSRRNTLALIDPRSFIPATEFITNIKNFSLVGEGKTMLFWNDFEIWLYNKETKEKSLITRTSEQINKVWPHPKASDYFFYSTRSNINAVEFQSKDYFNVTKILEAPNITSPAISPDGRYIYFIGGVMSNQELYKLDIK